MNLIYRENQQIYCENAILPVHIHLISEVIDECRGARAEGPSVQGTGEAYRALVPQGAPLTRQSIPSRGPQGRHHIQMRFHPGPLVCWLF